MTDFETLAEQGLANRGDLLGDRYEEPIAAPVAPPRHPDQPEFPAPGIYFGMPDEIYHAIPACSTSGLKRLSVSSMDFWADSWLNLDRVQIQKDYLDYGKAIHAYVLEGEDAYLARYAVDIDKSDFDDLLETTDQIKKAIVEAGGKPCTKGYDDNTRAAKKDDWIDQLLDIDPDAQIWERLLAAHREKNEGRELISALSDRRIRIAAKMILAHPEIGPIFSRGFSEVSVFWHCQVTGAPMKARFDYLKLRLLVDLKSFGNKGGMPIDRAIEKTIANYRYNLQHVIYDEAAEEAKRLVRERGAGAIHGANEAQQAFAFKWAEQQQPRFLFVFQQSGAAPVTRGKLMPKETTFSVTKSRAEYLKRKFVECSATFGTDPWLSIEPIDEIDDAAFPLYATEI